MARDSVVPKQFGKDLTPEQVLLDSLRFVDCIDQVVIAYREKDGTLRTYWSSGISIQERIGLLECAKYDLLRFAEKDHGTG